MRDVWNDVFLLYFCCLAFWEKAALGSQTDFELTWSQGLLPHLLSHSPSSGLIDTKHHAQLFNYYLLTRHRHLYPNTKHYTRKYNSLVVLMGCEIISSVVCSVCFLALILCFYSFADINITREHFGFHGKLMSPFT